MTTDKSVSPVRPNRRGTHPNSLKNLKPFPKGHIGNPNPVGFNITRRLKRLLLEDSDFIPPDANPKDKKFLEQIARQMVIKSCRGDVPMIKEVLDRTEGKVKEPESDLPQVPMVNFVFILPDGTQVSPVALREVKQLGNGNQP